VRNAQLYEQELGITPIRAVEDLVGVGAEARAAGFTAVKTNPLSFRSGTPAMFSGGFRVAPGVLDRDPALRATIGELHAQLEAMREGLGPDIDLSLDTAFAYRAEEYLKLVRALERHGLRWFELDSLDAGVVAQVRRGAQTPIASGESMYGLTGYRPLFEQAAVDVLLVDVMWNGSWTAQRVATLADAFGVAIAPHCPVSELGLLMSAHFAASVPNFDILEFRYDEMPWIWDFLTNPPKIENGVLTLPDGPGWGSDINEEAVAAHPPRTAAPAQGGRA
jgi:L-alanine-DL-glutamate epimerase-like enolase superfamily enzyme